MTRAGTRLVVGRYGRDVDVAYLKKASHHHNLRVRQKDYFDMAWLTMRHLCDPSAVLGDPPLSNPGGAPAARERLLGC